MYTLNCGVQSLESYFWVRLQSEDTSQMFLCECVLYHFVIARSVQRLSTAFVESRRQIP